MSIPILGKDSWPWSKEASEFPQYDNSKSFAGRWPKISIVTSSLNQVQFIEESIRTVILQEYPNLEYIIIDGGSTDGSLDVIKQYEKHLAYWISEPDDGYADGISKGFGVATGDIFAWLNTDDLYLPGALHTAARTFMHNPGIDWFIGEAIEIDSESKLIRPWFAPKVSLQTLLLSGCWFHQPATFWTRAAYDEVNGFDSTFQFAADYDLFLRLASNSRPLMIKRFLAAFRFHDASKTMTQQDICRADVAILQKRHGAGKYPLFIRRLYHQLFLRYVDRMNQFKRYFWE